MAMPKGIIATGFFRTGSTFMFSALRKCEELMGFYEPYHPDIIKYVTDTQAGLEAADKNYLGHTVEDDYFSEYLDIDLSKMNEAFASSRRTVNHPILSSSSTKQDLENYINFLIDYSVSKSKVPFLQANRFNFCLPWVAEKFPEFIKVLITRDPYSIFLSLQNIANKDGRFLAYHSDNSNFWNVNEVYKHLNSCYNLSLPFDKGYYFELYFIVSWINRISSRQADVVIPFESFNTNGLSAIKIILSSLSISSISAENYIIKNYKGEGLPAKPKEIIRLEKEVDDLIALAINQYV
jgi:hypothetical protein